MTQFKINFLKGTLVLMALIVLAFCTYWLPLLAKDAAERFPEFAHLRYPVLYGMCAAAIPFLFALYQAYLLLNLIEKQNVFTELAVKRLKEIKNCGTSLGLFYLTGLLFLGFQDALQAGIMLLGIAITFGSFVISVFAALLQLLLKSAMVSKLENELTV
jgi:hypothetical protein